MALSVITYKNLQFLSTNGTTPDSSLAGDGGTLIQDNFISIADTLAARLGRVSMTFATLLATNSALGSTFDVTVTSNFTLSNPTNGIDGQAIVWRIKQGGTGSYTMTLGTQFRLPSSGPGSIVLSTSVGTMDIFCAKYNAAASKWDVVSFVTGYG